MREFFSAEIKRILARAFDLASKAGRTEVEPAYLLLAFVLEQAQDRREMQALLSSGLNVRTLRRLIFQKPASRQRDTAPPIISKEVGELLSMTFATSRAFLESQILENHLLMELVREASPTAELLSRAGCQLEGLRLALWEGKRIAPEFLTAWQSEPASVPGQNLLSYELGTVKLLGFAEVTSRVLRESLEHAEARGADDVHILDVLVGICGALDFPYSKLAEKADLTVERLALQMPRCSDKQTSGLKFMTDFSPALLNCIQSARAVASGYASYQVELAHLLMAILSSKDRETIAVLAAICKHDELALAFDDALRGNYAEDKIDAVKLESQYFSIASVGDLMEMPLAGGVRSMFEFAARLSTRVNGKTKLSTEALLLAICFVEPECRRFGLSVNKLNIDLDLSESAPKDPLSTLLSDNAVKVIKETWRIAIDSPRSQIHVGHILLALTRVPDTGFFQVLDAMQATKLKVKLFVDFLFERDKLSWKPPFQVVQPQSEYTPTESSVLTSPLDLPPEPTNSEILSRLPDNCTEDFRLSLTECLYSYGVQDVGLVGLSQLLKYIFGCWQVRLIQPENPTIKLPDLESGRDGLGRKIMLAKFTDQADDVLRVASFRARNRGLKLSHWTFLQPTATDFPHLIATLLPVVRRVPADAVHVLFSRLEFYFEKLGTQGTAFLQDPAAWANFSPDSLALWREAEGLMAQHGLENFHDEFLLLVILKYWKENKPETFKALNLDIRSIERMINKLHRPETVISYRTSAPISPLELVLFLETQEEFGISKQMNPEHVVLGLCRIRDGNSAWILGKMMIDAEVVKNTLFRAEGKITPATAGSQARSSSKNNALGPFGSFAQLSEALLTARESASATKCGEVRSGHLLVGLIFADRQLADCIKKRTGLDREQVWGKVSSILYPQARGPFHGQGIEQSQEVSEVLQMVHDRRYARESATPLELIDVFNVLLVNATRYDVGRLFEVLFIDVEELRQNVLAMYARRAS